MSIAWLGRRSEWLEWQGGRGKEGVAEGSHLVGMTKGEATYQAPVKAIINVS